VVYYEDEDNYSIEDANAADKYVVTQAVDSVCCVLSLVYRTFNFTLFRELRYLQERVCSASRFPLFLTCTRFTTSKYQ